MKDYTASQIQRASWMNDADYFYYNSTPAERDAIACSIEAKVDAAIAADDFEWSQEDNGYVENTILVRPSGYWETVCQNEYGSLYGCMRFGNIDLTDEEVLFLKGSAGIFTFEF